ncbi:Uncharacterised protein [Slackia heliotrinireducens]|uniref:CGNR zinc finger domain-containing protein n=1 Tax=Slackia heliotrinireducens (strain ATCC 29202 / DSM 20476 / NCTC 11029 / RHS 1) TaxID=471855 RepID=C7N3C9_SLAHD|nr:hypothetical protein [Slackia heliotrinireducens]ACV23652.1 hypothetical protein Shel_26500 [Slackia heliotrinireducens DSM 20476]VEH03172.1 Uncharacterised protein [Slackia heliotrinireducens]
MTRPCLHMECHGLLKERIEGALPKRGVMPNDPYGTIPECVSRIRWAVGEVGHARGSGYYLMPCGNMDSLPVEFWNHQLLAVDPQNPADVARFIGEWGVPYHPIRNNPSATEEQRIECGIRATEAERLANLPSFLGRERVLGNGAWPSYISETEAAASLEWLQNLVACVVYGAELPLSGSSFMNPFTLETAALAASNPLAFRMPDTVIREASRKALSEKERKAVRDKFLMYRNLDSDDFIKAMGQHLGCKAEPPAIVRRIEAAPNPARGGTLYSCGMLAAAILNQLLESFADEAEWRECGNAECGRIFKRKQSKSDFDRKSSSKSKYCSDTCKNRKPQKRDEARKAKTAGKTAFGTEQTETGERKEV